MCQPATRIHAMPPSAAGRIRRLRREPWPPNFWLLPPAVPPACRAARAFGNLHRFLQGVVKLFASVVVIIHFAQGHADIGVTQNGLVKLAGPIVIALREPQVSLLRLPGFSAKH